MSVTAHHDKQSFEELVTSSFGFVESEAQMTFGGVRASGGTDPRDAALVARYTGSDFRFDVGWSEHELSLAVLINFGQLDVPRAERHVYFEPFVEYLTNGEDQAIVPYIAEGMSIKRIEAVMDQRQAALRDGLSPVIERVGKKLQTYLGQLRAASADQVSGYHQWMRSKR
jgi:hypothetical protein